MILKLKNNKDIFERVCNIMSYALNRGEETNWNYLTQTGSISNYESFHRVDLFPRVNNYWINLKKRTETHLEFEINFRYAKDKEDIFSQMLLYLFNNDIEVA